VKGELDFVMPRVAGASYRQLDHWVRQGYLRVQQHGPGSGHARQWPDEEVRVAAVMARLTAAGLPPALAERVARGDYEIGPGVFVLVDPERVT
jgi:hypothetical protein